MPRTAKVIARERQAKADRYAPTCNDRYAPTCNGDPFIGSKSNE